MNEGLEGTIWTVGGCCSEKYGDRSPTGPSRPRRMVTEFSHRRCCCCHCRRSISYRWIYWCKYWECLELRMLWKWAWFVSPGNRSSSIIFFRFSSSRTRHMSLGTLFFAETSFVWIPKKLGEKGKFKWWVRKVFNMCANAFVAILIFLFIYRINNNIEIKWVKWVGY